MTNTIMWFRRDLRLADNHALTAAIADAREAGGAVIPLFVVDDALWGAAGANRRWFLAGTLAALREDLGGALVVRHGEPAAVIAGLARRFDVSRVHRAQDVGIYGRARDEAVAAALGESCAVVESDSPWAVRPGTLRTGAGGAYKVYTPFLRAWRRHPLAAQARRPADVPTVDGVRSDALPAAPAVTADLPAPGEAAGHRALDRFLASPLDDYASPGATPPTTRSPRSSPGATSTPTSSRPGPTRRAGRGTSGWPRCRSTRARGPTTASQRGARGARATRSSTPGCASSSPRVGCTTGSA